ncbi:MAG: hypothetical protein KDC53_20895 [Saprospiraceae bacterium]|nr:hypothetical protein [Saprospiraceae bacterium]
MLFNSSAWSSPAFFVSFTDKVIQTNQSAAFADVALDMKDMYKGKNLKGEAENTSSTFLSLTRIFDRLALS